MKAFIRQIADNQWAASFMFDDVAGPPDSSFSYIRDWFDEHMPEAKKGWRTDRTSLTAFMNNEADFVFCLLKWG